jgi:hypothetical protein
MEDEGQWWYSQPVAYFPGFPALASPSSISPIIRVWLHAFLVLSSRLVLFLFFRYSCILSYLYSPPSFIPVFLPSFAA